MIGLKSQIRRLPREAFTESPSELARWEMLDSEPRPLFRCRWEHVVFIHLEVDPHRLQNYVPFELDLYAGRAYVSVVAFTLIDMRPSICSRAWRILCRPIHSHRFLNVRTYVRHNNSRGIYFLVEYLTSRLAVLLGPRIYGLPYRLGQLTYTHDPAGDCLCGEISDASRGRRAGAIRYSSSPPADDPEPAAPGSLEEFLLERYIAFTKRGQTRRLFRVSHKPWRIAPLSLHLHQINLLYHIGDWPNSARLVSAHYSPGVSVQIGRPWQLIQTETQDMGETPMPHNSTPERSFYERRNLHRLDLWVLSSREHSRHHLGGPHAPQKWPHLSCRGLPRQ